MHSGGCGYCVSRGNVHAEARPLELSHAAPPRKSVLLRREGSKGQQRQVHAADAGAVAGRRPAGRTPRPVLEVETGSHRAHAGRVTAREAQHLHSAQSGATPSVGTGH
jgi:hypothetical protein